MKYKIAYAKTASELEVKVNSLMDAGWQPIGGIATMSQASSIGGSQSEYGFNGYVTTDEWLYQAMIFRPSPKSPVSPG